MSESGEGESIFDSIFCSFLGKVLSLLCASLGIIEGWVYPPAP